MKAEHFPNAQKCHLPVGQTVTSVHTGAARWRWPMTALVLMALALAHGCGTVAVQEGTPGDSDAADVAVTADTSTSGTDAATTADTTAADVPVKAECETDFDCFAIVTGKNPCSPPSCEAGKCTKKKKALGTACIDPSLSPSDCQKMACNDTGICALSDLTNGTACGLGVCGKKCDIGLCVAASATDYDDGNACTKDYCNQGFEVRHDPITDLTELCDDGDACSSGDACVKGNCKGQALSCNDGIACTADSCDPVKGCIATPKDELCDDGDACTKQTCDAATGCKQAGFAVGAACDDGNACTKAETCTDKGDCTGESTCACTTDADCKQDNLCLGPVACLAGKCMTDSTKAVVCDSSGDTACMKSVCAASSGQCALAALTEGKACEDGNACTSVSTCIAGQCSGSADKKCDDGNACTSDACSPQSGCVYTANSASCDDGNLCTTSDICDKGGCTGTAAPCDDSINCTLDSCDTKTGKCAHAQNAKACDDGQPCTTDSCDLVKGCTSTPADGLACDDGDSCTTPDKCTAGKCGGVYTCQCKTNAECNDNNACTVDTCTAGKCVADPTAANGTACNSTDKCQKPNTGKCSAGVCNATNQPIVCTAATTCQNAACNPASGKCESTNKPDGTGCDADKDGCTVADKCATGQCVAGAKAQCASTGPCTAGTCKSDATQAGGYSCAQSALAAGTTCEDGQYCTTGDKCDSAGTCTAGPALSCASQTDACNTGTCDEAKNQCVKTAKPSTVACDDALYCSLSDHCDGAGKCIGGGSRVCPGGNCSVGACDEAGDKCATQPAASGAACTDGSVCTQTDTCDATGVCKGANALVCNDKNPCTTDSCDPVKGCIATPAAGAPCDDVNACTTGDKCDAAGKCQAGTFTCQCQNDAGCDDANACTTDKCTSNKCTNTITTGALCDDKNPCSLASTCSAAGACVADLTKTFDCSAQNDSCNTGVCYSSTTGAAACKQQPKAKAVTCDDTLYCTTGDLCDGAGKCLGGPAPTCPKPAVCQNALCTEAAKGCTTQPQALGTACSDGDPCTAGDNCSGAGICSLGAPVADFSACDDASATTGGDFCYNKVCKGFSLQSGPTPGPIGRIDYQSQTKAWTLTSTPAALADEMQPGSWYVYAAKSTPDASIQTWTQLMGGMPGTLHAAADQVMVGVGNYIWIQPTASTVWKNTSALHTAIKQVVPVSVDWDSVDTRLSGTTLYVGLTGYAPSNNSTYLVQCSGDPAFAGSWVCKAYAMSSSLKMASSKLWAYTGCIGCPSTVHHATAGLIKSGTLATGINEYNGQFNGSGYAATIGPAYSAQTSLLFADNWHSNYAIKNQTGSTFQWLVGPLGTIAYGKFGTAGILGASVTKGVQSSYTFRNIVKQGTTVLVSGSKPDPANSSNRLPVVFTHADLIEQQTGANYWTELVLPTAPYNQVTCQVDGITAPSMSVSDGGVMVWVNTCANPTLAKGVVARRGFIYYRPF